MKLIINIEKKLPSMAKYEATELRVIARNTDAKTKILISAYSL